MRKDWISKQYKPQSEPATNRKIRYILANVQIKKKRFSIYVHLQTDLYIITSNPTRNRARSRFANSWVCWRVSSNFRLRFAFTSVFWLRLHFPSSLTFSSFRSRMLVILSGQHLTSNYYLFVARSAAPMRSPCFAFFCTKPFLATRDSGECKVETLRPGVLQIGKTEVNN